jgi:subtilisin family serine protease
MKKTVRMLAIILFLPGFLFGLVQPVPCVQQTPTQNGVIDPRVIASINALPPGDMLTVIIQLKSQVDLNRIGGYNRASHLQKLVTALQTQARNSQQGIKTVLQKRQAEGLVRNVIYFWIFNGLAVTTYPDVILELASNPDVSSITPDQNISAPIYPRSSSPPEPNIGLINAPDMWDLGFRGQGVVVANLDTGVDLNHPDLLAQWRGGTNSWYDPYGQHAAPVDSCGSQCSGHGTWIMGVMVGRDAGGSAVGVAPDAQWIAVKIFNDQGSATTVAIHQGFQWLLDPDGNPSTPDAPQVVNNSWTFLAPGCDLTFQPDLQALSAAGILPVFAAGNFGPNPATSVSPSNNPDAFAVGAIYNSDLIWMGSSRGPSSCAGTRTVYPDLVAPGVNIYTTGLDDTYSVETGTSLAAPHVAGGLALLLSAYPSLSATDQQNALVNAAVDLGAPGPDNDYGYGRLDILGAYQWLSLNYSTPTPTPSAIPTQTPAPSALKIDHLPLVHLRAFYPPKLFFPVLFVNINSVSTPISPVFAGP